MKMIIIGLACLILSGCATSNSNYSLCMQVQEKMSKDMVIMEAARVQALIEMTKSADPTVKATGIMSLQKNDVRQLQIDCHKN